MLVAVMVLGLVVVVNVLLIARERAREAIPEPVHEPDAVTAHEVASVSQQRRRRIRDSLSELVGSARESWRLFKADRMTKTVIGEIASPTKLPSDSSRPPGRASTPPPGQE